MNGPTIEQVDAAVRAVLAPRARLLAQAKADRSASTFAGRLLSLKHAEQWIGRSDSIALAPGTVVTPLARDALKRAGVEVRWVSAKSVRAGEWGFATESRAGVVGPIRRALLSSSEVWHDLGDRAEPLAGWIAESPERAGVLLTDEAALAVWQTNREEGLRAASTHDADAVGRAVVSLGANLIAVEPHGRTIHELKHLIGIYRRTWTPDGGGFDHADRGGHRPGHALPVAPELARPAAGDRPADARGGLDRGLAPAWRGGGRA